MTSFIDCTISKKSRMPDLGSVRTWLAMWFWRFILEGVKMVREVGGALQGLPRLIGRLQTAR
jgi:hypothetical protein